MKIKFVITLYWYRVHCHRASCFKNRFQNPTIFYHRLRHLSKPQLNSENLNNLQVPSLHSCIPNKAKIFIFTRQHTQKPSTKRQNIIITSCAFVESLLQHKTSFDYWLLFLWCCYFSAVLSLWLRFKWAKKEVKCMFDDAYKLGPKSFARKRKSTIFNETIFCAASFWKMTWKLCMNS